MTPSSCADVLEWAQNPALAPEISPLAGQTSLLFHADAKEISETHQQQLVDWLRQLPCPSIGIAPANDSSLVTLACDLVVDSAQAASALQGNISRNPIAASVLVQTLRVTESLPVQDALQVESLAYATLQGGAEFKRWLETNKADAPAIPTDDGPAILIDREGDALTLKLNRASNRNAINVEMRDALVEAFQLVLVDDSIQSVKLSGLGKCFSVGGDLTEFGTLPDPASAHAIRAITMPGRFLAQCTDRVECHVHGACIGSGVELPAFARKVTAAPGSFFHLPESQFGLIPGGGGCVSIPRRIGRQRMAWWVLSGKRINAQTALEWGLVDEIAEQLSPHRTK